MSYRMFTYYMRQRCWLCSVPMWSGAALLALLKTCKTTTDSLNLVWFNFMQNIHMCWLNMLQLQGAFAVLIRHQGFATGLQWRHGLGPHYRLAFLRAVTVAALLHFNHCWRDRRVGDSWKICTQGSYPKMAATTVQRWRWWWLMSYVAREYDKWLVC